MRVPRVRPGGDGPQAGKRPPLSGLRRPDVPRFRSKRRGGPAAFGTHCRTRRRRDGAGPGAANSAVRAHATLDPALWRAPPRLPAANPDAHSAGGGGMAVAAGARGGAAGVRGGKTRLPKFTACPRAAAHRRNPGTTADLVTASLFAAL